MIQRWARQFAVSIQLGDFQASISWLKRFKRRHGIVSRKVTFFTSRSEQENQEAITESIRTFANSYARASRGQIWNFDQTGFNYEPSNIRTLSFRGERDTALLVDSRHKTTHSYTVQPMISRDGKIFPKVLKVTQEASDSFGPRVAKTVAELESKYGNIEIYASKSGKLTGALVNKWYRGTLAAAIRDVAGKRTIDINEEPSVMILADSWSGHANQAQQDELKAMGARFLRIPPQTTDKLQPLDVNFNRQLKIFYNRVIKEAFYKDALSNVTSREGIINLQSLLHNQFSSSQYRDMIRYAWHSTDPNFNRSELSHFPPKMVNAIQFEFDSGQKCYKTDCNEHSFVRCSHCGKLLCLTHFLDQSCFHVEGPVRQRRNSADGDCPARGSTNETCDLDSIHPDTTTTEPVTLNTADLESTTAQPIIDREISSTTKAPITPLATPDGLGTGLFASLAPLWAVLINQANQPRGPTANTPTTTSSPYVDQFEVQKWLTSISSAFPTSWPLTTSNPSITTTQSPTIWSIDTIRSKSYTTPRSKPTTTPRTTAEQPRTTSRLAPQRQKPKLGRGRN